MKIKYLIISPELNETHELLFLGSVSRIISKSLLERLKNTQTDLNWSPKVSFDESLLKIFEAYKTNISSAVDELQE